MINCFADKLPYIIEKSSVYFKLRGAQLLTKLGCPITIEQFIILDAIYFNTGICQRDLAKIVLKDRSNITRILNILENEGYIVRENTSKGNRMVKVAKLTLKGQNVINKYAGALKQDLDDMLSAVEREKLEAVKDVLQALIEKISKNANIQI